MVSSCCVWTNNKQWSIKQTDLDKSFLFFQSFTPGICNERDTWSHSCSCPRKPFLKESEGSWRLQDRKRWKPKINVTRWRNGLKIFRIWCSRRWKKEVWKSRRLPKKSQELARSVFFFALWHPDPVDITMGKFEEASLTSTVRPSIHSYTSGKRSLSKAFDLKTPALRFIMNGNTLKRNFLKTTTLIMWFPWPSFLQNDRSLLSFQVSPV